MAHSDLAIDTQTPVTTARRRRKWPPEASIFAVLIGMGLFFEAIGWLVNGQSFLLNPARLEVMILQM